MAVNLTTTPETSRPRGGISTEDVITAAQQLAAEGKKVSYASVRAVLGGGSYSDMKAGIEAYKSRTVAAKQADTTARPPAPDLITEKAVALAAEIWAEAFRKAQSNLEDERNALAARAAELEAQRAEAEELADALEAERLEAVRMAEESQAALAEARAELSETRGRLAATEAQVQQLREDLASAQGQALSAATEAAELRGRLKAK